jgi:hypothetical protein
MSESASKSASESASKSASELDARFQCYGPFDIDYGPFDIDELIRFCSENGKNEANDELLSVFARFAQNAEESLKTEYEEQNETMDIQNAKPFQSVAQVRLLYTEEPTKENYDSVTYRTELKLGLEKSLTKFPSYMPFPGGFAAVIFALTYKSCLFVDQYKLYMQKKITDKEFWDVTWLFFEDLNYSDLETIQTKQKQVLDKCEERSRELHQVQT